VLPAAPPRFLGYMAVKSWPSAHYAMPDWAFFLVPPPARNPGLVAAGRPWRRVARWVGANRGGIRTSLPIGSSTSCLYDPKRLSPAAWASGNQAPAGASPQASARECGLAGPLRSGAWGWAAATDPAARLLRQVFQAEGLQLWLIGGWPRFQLLAGALVGGFRAGRCGLNQVCHQGLVPSGAATVPPAPTVLPKVK